MKKSKTDKVSAAGNFSAMPSSFPNTYDCYADTPNPGWMDWYIVNVDTWVYTYLGSTNTGDIQFYFDKPLTYNSYRVWAEGSSGAEWTNDEMLGDPYIGVSIENGVLAFTDTSALNSVLDRLDEAMDRHQTDFSDPFEHLTDDEMSDYADAMGFDPYLPLKEFESYFGLYSLRQVVENEEAVWLALADPFAESVYPDDKYTIDDEVDRALHNQYSQVKVGGELLQPVSAIESPHTPVACNTEHYTCIEKGKVVDKIAIGSTKMITRKVLKGTRSTGNDEMNIFPGRLKAKLRNYRLKNNFWKPLWTNVSAKVYGDVWDRSSPELGGLICYAWDSYNSDERPYRRRLWVNAKKRKYSEVFAKNCSIHGDFKVNGSTSTLSLSF